MQFTQVINEVTIDSFSASSFFSIVNALQDKRMTRIESKMRKAMTYITNYFAHLSKGSGAFIHLNGNEMTKMLGCLNLYFHKDMTYLDAEKEYNKIVILARKRMSN